MVFSVQSTVDCSASVQFWVLEAVSVQLFSPPRYFVRNNAVPYVDVISFLSGGGAGHGGDDVNLDWSLPRRILRPVRTLA